LTLGRDALEHRPPSLVKVERTEVASFALTAVQGGHTLEPK
jgi:hypothetical protein